MKYDITKNKAPEMPNLGKGTECIKILLSQASKDMHDPLVPMLFPVLGAHISGAEFQYPDLSWKEPCGQMAKSSLILPYRQLSSLIGRPIRKTIVSLHHEKSGKGN